MTIDAYLEGIMRHGQDKPKKPKKPATFYFYGCRDADDPLEDGDLFMFAGQAECAGYTDARKRAASIMPNDFVGYVIFTDLVGGAGKSDILVNGVFVDNRG